MEYLMKKSVSQQKGYCVLNNHSTNHGVSTTKGEKKEAKNMQANDSSSSVM